ncbi:MAG: hypothetical protein JXR13_15050 [Thalassovita sp.]
MAISFPLSLDDFFDGLRVTQLKFELGENMEMTGATGRGEILTAATGGRLWHGVIHIATATASELDQVISKIDLLREPGGSFMIGDIAHRALAADPSGAMALSGAATVSTIDPNNVELRLAGDLPGLEIGAGDQFSIDHGDGSFSYYRVVVGGAFEAAGPMQTPPLEVRPAIAEVVATGMPVTLYRPALKAVYVPESYKGGIRLPGGRAQGVTFAWMQTLL